MKLKVTHASATAPTYRKAVAKGERFSVGRALKRAGLNLRDEARYSAPVGAHGVGNAVEEVGAGDFGGLVNFGLVVLCGIFGLLLLNLLVGDRGSTITSKSLTWTSGLLNRIVSPTDPLVGLGHSSASPAPSSAPAASSSSLTKTGVTAGGFKLTAPTGRIVPISGSSHSIDAAYTGLIGWIEKTFSVSVSSGYRTTAQNAAAGGAPNSDHLTGAAADFVGSQTAMQRLYKWASTLGFAYVESPAQAVAAGEGEHVHISFYRPSTPHPGAN